MGYSFFRRILALLPAVVLWLTPGVVSARHVGGLDHRARVLPVAQEQDAAVPADFAELADLPDLAILSSDGRAIEEILDGAGLGAAWRSSVGLDPIARAMTVDYAGAGAEVAGLLATVLARSDATEAHTEVAHRLRKAALELNRAREVERERLITRVHADVHFRGTHALMESVALDLFSGGDPQSEALLGLDVPALTDAQRTHELTSHTLEEMLERRQAAEAAFHAAVEAHKRSREERRALQTTHEGLQTYLTELARLRVELDRAARSRLPGAAVEFALASVPSEPGLTPRALTAYVRAEQQMAELAPGCRISWRTIAAVGAVEGKHGSHGKRALGMEGLSDRPIVGIPLDGVATDNFGEVVASIRDTDGGRFDGDPVFDRAVGPMQFIPETWARWGLDGDGDGEPDPHDIDDAALTAAAYLCSYGSLRSWDRWNVAVFGYNHSVAYIHSVKASLDRMDRVRLPDIDEVDELEIAKPSGTWTPPPEPEPEPGSDEGTATAEAG